MEIWKRYKNGLHWQKGLLELSTAVYNSVSHLLGSKSTKSRDLEKI